jgi:hypothetical protein
MLRGMPQFEFLIFLFSPAAFLFGGDFARE